MSEIKRRWFQIHLSTAIVLLIVASVFLGANLVDRQSGDSLVYGWPIAFHERPLNPRERWIDYYRIHPVERTPRLILDIGIFLFASAVIGIALERRIRRAQRSI